jgi:hypothetical protein
MSIFLKPYLSTERARQDFLIAFTTVAWLNKVLAIFFPGRLNTPTPAPLTGIRILAPEGLDILFVPLKGFNAFLAMLLFHLFAPMAGLSSA